MTPSERDIEAFFPRFGLTPVRIPPEPGRAKTPDYEIKGDRWPILTEAKSRQDPDELRALPPDEIYEHEEQVDNNPGVHRILASAAEQSEEFDPRHEQVHLTWFSPESPLRGASGAEFFLRALYGVRDLIDTKSHGLDPIKCIYATLGSFERCPAIDGSILVVNRVPVLLLNDFGQLVGRLRDTRLAEIFEENDGLITADRLRVRSKGIAIAGGNAGRSESEVLSLLCSEQGLQAPSFLQPRMYAAVIRS